ncbi:uncharacterized protein BP01DRAFT_356344 [Aspergillus saccharolyticus JOP 1030-1]|uniref:VWFA domain-containing protein n=1 Tax=Aspergillus saccharolyticus JOP 1030-1 TaxID=1450539 RepID=A0A319AG88_9EURO|nr:hypothetical protein BP01DRAFT_356344 [Aspergillus saccharolyticus JOP 1030-1]PYH45712.1 hypothetical protein BP01DRAFT_356344 [Aspergillus saccharolyticus JOP 1030-1]
MPLLQHLRDKFTRQDSTHRRQDPRDQSYNSADMGQRHSREKRRSRATLKTTTRSIEPNPMSTDRASQAKASSPDPWSPPPYSAEAALAQSKPSVVSSASSGDSPYSFLREFDTIFVVDDSTSMRGQRWKEAENAIAAIAPICTQYDKDGIDVWFLNHRRDTGRRGPGSYTNITLADNVREIFGSVSPKGPTPFGRRLMDILGPYMRDLEKKTAASDGFQDSTQLLKPLNVIAITDGAFTDDAESVIVDVAQRLDKISAVPWQVGIQFFQIGDDAVARQYLQDLDDELGKMTHQKNLRDIVDTVPWRGDKGQTLSADGILKCVLGAVHRKYDKRDGHR